MNTSDASSSLTIRMVAAVLIATTAAAWHSTVRAQALATQTSADGGVTLKVTPKPLAAGAREWGFEVVLDTHSGSLDDDLVNSVLLVADGREIKPLGWAGAVPGGHHREGVLKFAAPATPPSAVELRVQRPNEPAPRVFRWDGAALR